MGISPSASYAENSSNRKENKAIEKQDYSPIDYPGRQVSRSQSSRRSQTCSPPVKLRLNMKDEPDDDEPRCVLDALPVLDAPLDGVQTDEAVE